VLPDRLALDTMVAVAVADAPDAAEDIDRPRAT
jgi:hypothetical protein